MDPKLNILGEFTPSVEWYEKTIAHWSRSLSQITAFSACSLSPPSPSCASFSAPSLLYHHLLYPPPPPLAVCLSFRITKKLETDKNSMPKYAHEIFTDNFDALLFAVDNLFRSVDQICVDID
jgi:hypothetical protein